MTLKPPISGQELLAINTDLRARLDRAEETLRAIGSGEADALVVAGLEGERLLTFQGSEAYRTLIEEMSEGALTVTAKGLILYANRHFAVMLKMPLEKVIGSKIWDWIALTSQAQWQALLTASAVGNLSLIHI